MVDHGSPSYIGVVPKKLSIVDKSGFRGGTTMVFGGVQGDVVETDCDTLIGDMLAPGATSDPCTFAVEYAHPGSGGDLQNTVTATIKSTTAPFEEVDVMGSTTINVDLNVGP